MRKYGEKSCLVEKKIEANASRHRGLFSPCTPSTRSYAVLHIITEPGLFFESSRCRCSRSFHKILRSSVRTIDPFALPVSFVIFAFYQISNVVTIPARLRFVEFVAQDGSFATK